MVQENQKTAIQPTRSKDYAQWYQQVIVAAELAENSPVRGCMVIRPWGYALWEAIQQDLDRRLKATGHVNAYFPLLIPLSYLESEAQHVDGFAKECAVVTHSRLVEKNGSLVPDGELEEPYIIRPTSETIIGAMYAKWIQSYRDLPVLINQWANVMRWEMRTRMFLRTSEFLWQEGHTAHATADEAKHETLAILDIYQQFIEEVLAIPVIKGEKTCFERFPGAINTYTVEAMMQDCKALQAGTSHFLGQNFSQAANIQFLDKDGVEKHVWTTSWGVSTRLIGGLIMTHADDNGFVAPPRVAPQHIVILPIYRNDDDRNTVLDYCKELITKLSKLEYHRNDLRVILDDRDLRGGDKTWQWIKKGVPLRVEIGMRDIQQGTLCVSRRDNEVKAKEFIAADDFVKSVTNLLDAIQSNLLLKARQFMQQRIFEIDNLEKFKQFFADDVNQNSGFVSCYAVDDACIEEYIKPLKVTARCIPLVQSHEGGRCIFTGREVKRKIIFAKAY